MANLERSLLPDPWSQLFGMSKDQDSRELLKEGKALCSRLEDRLVISTKELKSFAPPLNLIIKDRVD